MDLITESIQDHWRKKSSSVTLFLQVNYLQIITTFRKNLITKKPEQNNNTNKSIFLNISPTHGYFYNTTQAIFDLCDQIF